MRGELVSVIIPVYNVCSYLDEALESVIHQTYSNLEIIIINDGSTDKSGEICDKFAQKDRRISVLHTENMGLASARNLGLYNAKGKFISFVDSDDWIEPQTIETLVVAIHQSNAYIASCRSCREYVGKTVHSPERVEKEYLYKGADILPAFARGIISDVVWNKLYRVSCFSELRFPDGRNYEDVFTMWRLMKKLAEEDRVIVVLSEDLFHRRMRKSSISHTRSLSNIIDCWEAYQRKYKELPDYQQWLLPDCIRAIGRMWLNYTGFSREDREKAVDVIQEMKSFSKTHHRKVMAGRYSYSIKIPCLLSQSNNSFIMWLCYHGRGLRMRIKNGGKQLYD